jgi:hypothetical protein
LVWDGWFGLFGLGGFPLSGARGLLRLPLLLRFFEILDPQPLSDGDELLVESIVSLFVAADRSTACRFGSKA